jgi:hypothetical protein
MFGGWGPHLGHLVRAQASSGGGESLWFVDDYCSQAAGLGQCDVLHDHTLGYFERTATGWQSRGTATIPGQVQQNTATIASASGDTLLSYGVDVSGLVLRECSYAIASSTTTCTALPFSLPGNSNYIGAAISPTGAKVVWWTRVQDGGGGDFYYVVDYGGGWNGPRSGTAAGYNDASYINIAFGAGATQNLFTMHVQLVSGWAPNWEFHGAVGYGDLTTTDPVTWADVLTPPSGDTIASTNDVWIDPGTGDTHLVARSGGGAAVCYHRTAAGVWSGPQLSLAATYRARFVYSADRLVLLYGPNSGDLAYRIAPAAARVAGAPIDWAALPEVPIALPTGYGAVIAIYPESPAYQTTPAQGIHAVVVGQTEQNVATHVAIE